MKWPLVKNTSDQGFSTKNQQPQLQLRMKFSEKWLLQISLVKKGNFIEFYFYKNVLEKVLYQLFIQTKINLGEFSYFLLLRPTYFSWGFLFIQYFPRIGLHNKVEKVQYKNLSFTIWKWYFLSIFYPLKIDHNHTNASTAIFMHIQTGTNKNITAIS